MNGKSLNLSTNNYAKKAIEPIINETYKYEIFITTYFFNHSTLNNKHILNDIFSTFEFNLKMK